MIINLCLLTCGHGFISWLVHFGFHWTVVSQNYYRLLNAINFLYRSRGKESTEVRKTENKGKESENSYRKLKSSWWTGTQTHTRKQNQNISNSSIFGKSSHFPFS